MECQLETHSLQSSCTWHHVHREYIPTEQDWKTLFFLHTFALHMRLLGCFKSNHFLQPWWTKGRQENGYLC